MISPKLTKKDQLHGEKLQQMLQVEIPVERIIAKHRVEIHIPFNRSVNQERDSNCSNEVMNCGFDLSKINSLR